MGVYEMTGRILKCFGGGWDGQHTDTFRELEDGEPYRLPARLTTGKVANYDGAEAEPVAIQHETYIVHSLRTSKIRVRFLVLDGIELESILLKVFS